MKEDRGWLSILIGLLSNVGGDETIHGSGNVVEEDREVSDFTGLALTGFGDLAIEMGEDESLRIEAEDNLMQYLETEVRGGMLKIGVRENVKLKPEQPVRFYVTAKELDTIALSGSGNIEAPGLKAEQFRTTISGSGNVRISALNADSHDAKISGSGKLAVAGGEAERQDIVVTCHQLWYIRA